MEIIINDSVLKLVLGDITEQDTEAIVNAANTSLLGGGGVDGAIHRAGGGRILDECKRIRAKQGGCPPGEAVLTSGGNLHASYVIHTVGPIWRGGDRNEPEILKNAYKNCLELAVKNKLSSVSFPSISTGIYRYPITQAALIALGTVIDFLKSESLIKEVRFVLFLIMILEFTPMFYNL